MRQASDQANKLNFIRSVRTECCVFKDLKGVLALLMTFTWKTHNGTHQLVWSRLGLLFSLNLLHWNRKMERIMLVPVGCRWRPTMQLSVHCPSDLTSTPLIPFKNRLSIVSHG
jgi:hypothetical protein